MGNRTPFYDQHIQSGAKIVDFAGWDMPLHYGSQLKEHLAVRQQVGMFDVSHMGVVDCHGPHVAQFLRHLLANNVDKLASGKALYTCMLNDTGGVIDDLIVYKLNDTFYRLVINAGTRTKDIQWMRDQAANFEVEILERDDLAMLAIQGPLSLQKLSAIFPLQDVERIKQLKPFSFHHITQGEYKDFFIACTGYTGEDGFEIILPAIAAPALWEKLLALQVAPSGLGARDTLRLEAGLNLYGNDMDESVTPLESNLNWTVAFEPKERAFVGRVALESQIADGVKQRLVGLILDGPGIMRHHQLVILNNGDEGEITSGGYSPTLEKSIALARIPVSTTNNTTNTTANDQEACWVEIRDRKVKALIVKPPFVPRGKRHV